jgi:hypothetical protein
MEPAPRVAARGCSPCARDRGTRDGHCQCWINPKRATRQFDTDAAVGHVPKAT